MAPPRWRADLALATVALVWGVTFVVVKRALAEISTMYFLALRFSLASACLLLLFSREFSLIGSRSVLRGLAAGGVAGIFLWLGYVLQTFGLKYTSAGNSGFLTGLYIVLVPVFGVLVYRRAPRAIEVVGILIATFGMILLTLPGVRNGFTVNRGDLLTVGCAVAFAVHLLILGFYSQREMFQAVALGQITCTAFLSALCLTWEPPVAVWSTAVVGAILTTAVLATALAFALQTWGQRYTTPTRTALIFALEPVFALATAVSFGGESLTLMGIAGAGLILTGLLIVECKKESTG